MDSPPLNDTFYEKQLRQALAPMLTAGRAAIVERMADTFALLGRSFPLSGSKIDWTEVPGAQGIAVTDHRLLADAGVEFWQRIAQTERLSGMATYVCDGGVGFSVEASVPDVSEMLRHILEIPQHHYLIGAGAAWCLCFTMEGDVDFGRSPTFSGRH